MRRGRSNKGLISRIAGSAAVASILVVLAASDGGAAGLVGARAARTASAQGSSGQADPKQVASKPAVSATAAAPHLDNAPDAATLTFDVSTSDLSPSVSILADPDRVLVDVPRVDFVAGPGETRRAPGRRGRGRRPGIVASYRFGLLAPERSRIVVDLDGPARAVASVRRVDGRVKLVVAISRTDRASFLAAARPAVAIVAPAEAQAPRAPGRPTIVLDPGHGGPDTGAIVDGVLEKDVALAFVRSLASKLEAAGGFNVVMTRATDVFIPLSERVQVARNANAALMISIHADTLPETADVSGATVYTVSDKASDAYAAKVAAKENSADAAVGMDGQTDVADVNDILFDLTRQETRAYSHVFARTLVNYWKIAGRLNKNPSRSAGFVVLKAPDVPSVLLELGYLSSPIDSAELTSETWRDKATARMAQAIEAYFADRNGTAKAAAGVPMPLPSLQATADLGGPRR